MDSPRLPTSPDVTNGGGAIKSSSSSTRLVDDVMSLTSFNPFSEEDEHDQSSYTLVSSLFSRVRNSLAAPLTSAVTAATTNSNTQANSTGGGEQRRVSSGVNPTQSSSPVVKPASDRFRPKVGSSGPSLAPPLVSVVPALSQIPAINGEPEKASTMDGRFYSPTVESYESSLLGASIPGFPIQDDARSIHTTTSLRRSASVSKVFRRIRGEGISQVSTTS